MKQKLKDLCWDYDEVVSLVAIPDAKNAVFEWERVEEQELDDHQETLNQQAAERLIKAFPDQPAMMNVLEGTFCDEKRVIELLPDHISLALVAGMAGRGRR